MNSIRKLIVLLASIPVLALSIASVAGPAYPVKPSANGRYLVDQNNQPFLIIGDSPQGLIVDLTLAEADMFFANRASYGFNAVWINLLCSEGTGGRVDGSIYDGTLPFTARIPSTSTYDMTAPNEAYFARVDQIVNLAANHGIAILLDPAETISWLNPMLDNGTNRCRIYGRYLGQRYKNFPNIIWMSGNDFQRWREPDREEVARAVALGIQDADTNHIQTIGLDYPVSSSLDNTNWNSIIQLNAAYTYYPTYAQLLKDYNRSNYIPTFMVEANYEYEDNWGQLGLLTPRILRLQEYWTMLCGTTGQLYGNHFTWQFISGWDDSLDTPGSVQIGYMKNLFAPRPWYDLIPDTNHTVLTSGYGTYLDTGSVVQSDYATAARTSNGSLVMAYLPTARTVTMNMAKLNGTTKARWYDPAGGTFVAISGSPFVNTGAQNFTTPGTNADGDTDWVLVLETVNPAISIRKGNVVANSIVISFDTMLGKWYELQYATNLPGAWQPLVSNIQGIDDIVEITDTNVLSHPRRFYRTKVLGTQPIITLNLALSGTQPGNLVFSFNSITGSTYELQATTNLLNGPWQTVETNLAGTGQKMTITETNTPGLRACFYRLKVTLP